VPETHTFLRATLRHPAFCKGWDALIKLGLTRDNDSFESKGHTYLSWLKSKTGYQSGPIGKHIAQKLEVADDDKVISMLEWLGLFEETAIKGPLHSSADILLSLLQEKWKMEPTDRDMVVMQHEIEYMHRGKKVKVTSSMVIRGEDSEHSAMAKTVGLPIGVLTKLVVNKKIKPPTGVLIPNMPSIYRPVLTELAHYGIVFDEIIE
jgi:saccharopine dehydrogenase-like NADP-dependent oxidoreductase